MNRRERRAFERQRKKIIKGLEKENRIMDEFAAVMKDKAPEIKLKLLQKMRERNAHFENLTDEQKEQYLKEAAELKEKEENEAKERSTDLHSGDGSSSNPSD